MVLFRLLGGEIELEVLCRAFAAVDEAALGLFQGSQGVSAESRKFAGMKESEPFSDIAVRRGARVADLIAKFEILRSRSDRSKREDLTFEFVRKLPGHEISKVADAHTKPIARCVPAEPCGFALPRTRRTLGGSSSEGTLWF